jgi:RND superfamily putative drug exporter
VLVRATDCLARHRSAALVVWLVVAVAALPLALRQSDRLSTGGFVAVGSESSAADRVIERDFPDAARAHLAVVLAGSDQSASTVEAAASEVRALLADNRYLEFGAPQAAPEPRRGDSGRLLLPLQIDSDGDREQDVAADIATVLPEHIEGTRIYLVGQGALRAEIDKLAKQDVLDAELIGIPAVLFLLLIVFGSVTAAALPLIQGIVAVTITGALIFLVSRSIEMSVFVTNVASMIGIGVAVDYSLFVLARYRTEIHRGLTPFDARRIAMATSGRAVLFSGITVMLSLSGLWLTDNTAVRSMAVGAIMVVGTSVVACLTLLPALIQLSGQRAIRRTLTLPARLRRAVGRRGRGRSEPDGAGSAAPAPLATKWIRAVTRRPVLAALVSSAVMIALAVPALSMQVGEGLFRYFPLDHDIRTGADEAAAIVGQGALTPVRIVLTPSGGTPSMPVTDEHVKRTLRSLEAEPAVATARPNGRSTDGRSALVVAELRSGGETAEAKSAIPRIRSTLASEERDAPQVMVAGVTAAQLDFTHQVEGSMWKIALFILGLSGVILVILLRSLVLPLKAILMNCLSVGAAYGVIVAVFQWGWLDSVTGIRAIGEIDILTPPLVLAVVFGLSMDYEVFLLTRVRERFEATGDPHRAVVEGISWSARTITSAALIMVVVFAAFIGTGVTTVQQLGVGLAVAIALDATLVRFVLVPATMEILGGRNWWLPKPLVRILPGRTHPRVGADL